MTSEQIAEAIAQKEGCLVTSFRHHRVTERFREEIVFDGIITQFYLKDNPAPSCFGWIDPDTQELVVVKELPPVTSPETALRAYIVAKK